jgi:hypothetical protein
LVPGAARAHGGLSTERLQAMPYTASVSQDGFVEFPRASHELVGEPLRGLEVVPRELAERLAEDLRKRANGTDAAYNELVRCGLPAQLHSEALRAAELRHTHPADRELVRLQDESSAILERRIDGAIDDVAHDELVVRYHEAEQQQRTDR